MGFAVERSQECALNLVSKLGNSTVEQILRAPKPWSDLKARTNLLQPPLKIVTSQELQDMIKKRTVDGKPMGSKSNKKKQQNEIVELKSHQLSIPHASLTSNLTGKKLARFTHPKSKTIPKALYLPTSMKPFLSLR